MNQSSKTNTDLYVWVFEPIIPEDNPSGFCVFKDEFVP